MTTVFAAFEKTARAHGAKPFLQVPHEKVELSYAQALDRISAIAQIYARRGYGSGHRVALKLPNCAGFLLHFLALNSLGAAVVPVSPESQRAELDYVLTHSEAVLVVDGAALEKFDPPAAPPPGNASECALLYTSGTTGKPKGCLLSNFYFLNIGQRYVEEGGLCALRHGEERLITPLPLFHMNALACSTTAMILSAGCVVQLDRFHPRTWWREVIASRATIVHYLGVMPAILMQLPPSAEDRGHRVRFGYGANANPKDHAAFEERFGFPLIEAWAMTETGGGAMTARQPRAAARRHALHRAAEGDVEMNIAESGGLLVRHAGADARRGFFSGYLKDAAATEESWRDGWFHTGDSVRRGPDGQLHFVDRLKNIIRRSGENIAALEVETAVAGHPAVRLVAVVAAPDAVRDEEVLACVVLQESASPVRDTALSIQQHCLERLSYFKAPGYVAFVDELPVTSTNKVQKARLADFASNPLASPRCFDLRDGKRRPTPL